MACTFWLLVMIAAENETWITLRWSRVPCQGPWGVPKAWWAFVWNRNVWLSKSKGNNIFCTKCSFLLRTLFFWITRTVIRNLISRYTLILWVPLLRSTSIFLPLDCVWSPGPVCPVGAPHVSTFVHYQHWSPCAIKHVGISIPVLEVDKVEVFMQAISEDFAVTKVVSNVLSPSFCTIGPHLWSCIASIGTVTCLNQCCTGEMIRQDADCEMQPYLRSIPTTLWRLRRLSEIYV